MKFPSLTKGASRKPMANEGQHSDPPELTSGDDIDKVLGQANPNPTRAGCPPREVLIALARRERPIGDPAYRAPHQVFTVLPGVPRVAGGTGPATARRRVQMDRSRRCPPGRISWRLGSSLSRKIARCRRIRSHAKSRRHLNFPRSLICGNMRSRGATRSRATARLSHCPAVA